MAISYDTSDGSGKSFALRTAAGWRVAAGFGRHFHSNYDPGCPINYYEEVTTDVVTYDEPMPLLVVTDNASVMSGMDEKTGALLTLVTRRVTTCRFVSEVLTCATPLPVNETSWDPTPDGKPVRFAKPDALWTVTQDGQPKALQPFASSLEEIKRVRWRQEP